LLKVIFSVLSPVSKVHDRSAELVETVPIRFPSARFEMQSVFVIRANVPHLSLVAPFETDTEQRRRLVDFPLSRFQMSNHARSIEPRSLPLVVLELVRHFVSVSLQRFNGGLLNLA
jgi:hypothetical protein